jgi:hypothetical protein
VGVAWEQLAKEILRLSTRRKEGDKGNHLLLLMEDLQNY